MRGYREAVGNLNRRIANHRFDAGDKIVRIKGFRIDRSWESKGDDLGQIVVRDFDLWIDTDGAEDTLFLERRPAYFGHI